MTPLQPALFAPTDTTARDPLPEWLLRRLGADGTIDLASGATRRARPAKCSRCGSWIIRGLDADWCALAVDADPEPLTPEGEALARLARIAVRELCITGGRPQLEQRDVWSIAPHPAGSRATDVLAVHRCPPDGLPLPRGPSRLPVPSRPADLPETPPF